MKKVTTIRARALRIATLRFLALTLWSLILVIGVICLNLVGPRIEEAFFPVANSFQAVNRGIDDKGQLTFRLHFTKYRPECLYQYMSWFGQTKDGESTPLAYEVRLRSRPIAYPRGLNLSRVIALYVDPIYGQFFATFHYQCPLTPWSSSILVGPFINWSLPPIAPPPAEGGPN